MEKTYYNTIDKSDWGEGPWQDEPDKEQWVDAVTGLPCLLKRNRWGNLCGYVGVAPGHRYYEQDYSDVSVDVHGALTYSDACEHGDEEHSICHIPDPGEPDNVWWFGFDCGHYDDYQPGAVAMDPEFASFWAHGTYKTAKYVKRECAKLAKQLAAAA